MKIKRTLYTALSRHLEAKEITVLTGARQVGKTTLLKALKKELEHQNKNVGFFNLDIHSDQPYFQNQETLLQKLDLEFGRKPAYVFIDEIQRKENAGLFLKGLFDRDLPYKFIVSGSGSLELKEKIQESLTGRKRQFELQPVSFIEMVHYKTNYRYENNLADFFEIETQKTEELFLEYLNFGGYPRLVTEPVINEKKALLDEIFSSYLEKDITNLLSLARPDAFVLLIKILADRIGSPLNKNHLSTQTGISLPTLNKYLWYAEKTFIIKMIRPFFRNIKKELTKSPQVFFADLGLHNYAINKLGQIGPPYNTGMVFENFIFQILYQKSEDNGWDIKYWRTTDKAEVDFVIDNGTEVIPLEVKYQKLKQPRISRSFRSFLTKYRPAQAFLINLSLESDIQIENTHVHFIPYYRLFHLF